MEEIIFHGTPMRILLTTKQAGGTYCVMEMAHRPNVGPAPHQHPAVNETFYVLDGTYHFTVEGTTTEVAKGGLITVERGRSHYYKSGPNGGRVLIMMPPNLESYFRSIAELEKASIVPFEQEATIAESYGQVFLGTSNTHW
jgi:quercetin dioxygenase-like cupin family protein